MRTASRRLPRVPPGTTSFFEHDVGIARLLVDVCGLAEEIETVSHPTAQEFRMKIASPLHGGLPAEEVERRRAGMVAAKITTRWRSSSSCRSSRGWSTELFDVAAAL